MACAYAQELASFVSMCHPLHTTSPAPILATPAQPRFPSPPPLTFHAPCRARHRYGMPRNLARFVDIANFTFTIYFNLEMCIQVRGRGGAVVGRGGAGSWRVWRGETRWGGAVWGEAASGAGLSINTARARVAGGPCSLPQRRLRPRMCKRRRHIGAKPLLCLTTPSLLSSLPFSLPFLLPPFLSVSPGGGSGPAQVPELGGALAGPG